VVVPVAQLVLPLEVWGTQAEAQHFLERSYRIHTRGQTWLLKVVNQQRAMQLAQDMPDEMVVIPVDLAKTQQLI
jgi:hypothetical protein